MKFKATLSFLALLFSIYLPAFAGQGLIEDIVLNPLGTNRVTAPGTNQYAGQTNFIGNDAAIVILSAGVNTTNLAGGIVTVTWDGSVDGKVWLTNAVTMTAPVCGTNTCQGLYEVPVGSRFPYLRVSQFWNTNAVAANIFSNLFARLYIIK